MRVHLSLSTHGDDVDVEEASAEDIGCVDRIRWVSTSTKVVMVGRCGISTSSDGSCSRSKGKEIGVGGGWHRNMGVWRKRHGEHRESGRGIW